MSLGRSLEKKRAILEEILATFGEAHHPPPTGLTGYFILAFHVSFLRTTVQVIKSFPVLSDPIIPALRYGEVAGYREAAGYGEVDRTGGGAGAAGGAGGATRGATRGATDGAHGGAGDDGADTGGEDEDHYGDDGEDGLSALLRLAYLEPRGGVTNFAKVVTQYQTSTDVTQNRLVVPPPVLPAQYRVTLGFPGLIARRLGPVELGGAGKFDEDKGDEELDAIDDLLYLAYLDPAGPDSGFL
ncbi:hypothetical protein B0H14DRAFT_3438532 [Mycena olivaceomarginata]|nr:hypothetical protein B0H14DRAFT_3438532 [Mycena olivaceomarginata]